MDGGQPQNLNQSEPQPVPQYEIGSSDPHAHLRKYIKIGGIVAVILILMNIGVYYWRNYSYNKIANVAEEGNKRVEEIRANRKTAKKEFKDEELGFSVSYPEDWRYENCQEGGQGAVAFGKTEEKLIQCQSEFVPVGPVIIQTFMTDNFQIYLSSLVNGLEDTTQEDVMLGTKAAVKVSGTTKEVEGPALPGGQNVIYIVAYSGGKIYQLGLFEVEGYLDMTNFNKMVSSFKFTN